MFKQICGIFLQVLTSFAMKSRSFDLNFHQVGSTDLCTVQLGYFQENLDQGASWARRMRDAWGNFPSGVLSGNLFDFGGFDQCIDVRYNSEIVGEIVGQHCTLMVGVHDKSDTVAKFMPPSRSTDNSVLGVGICVPSSCAPKRIKEIADVLLYQTLNITTSSSYDQNTFCTTEHRPIESTNALLIFSTVFFASFILLMAISTAYDIIWHIRGIQKLPVLCAFSVYSNSKTIMTLKSSSPKEMVFLHGIRSLSMISIVIGHTYMITYWLVPAINSHALIDWIGDVSSMVVLAGFMGVDTFFMLSSLLLTLSVFRELDRTNKINIFILYIKRYFRITVPVAAAILLTVTFLYHMANGPLWGATTRMAAIHLCEKNWWSTLLYVGNYVNPGELCFGHSWYLMVDMQLYFFSPFVLYPIWRFRKHTALIVWTILLIACISVIFVFVIFLMNDFRTNFLSELGADKEMRVYTATHARIDSWMCGILIGFIIYKIEGKTIKLSKARVAVGWALTTAMLLAVTFGQYPLQQENFKDNPIVADALYDSFKRISWCLAVGWIILACHLAQDGIVKRFLSLPIWMPISKLSFCIYLIHVPVQLIYLSSIRSPQYFSNFRAIYKFFGDFGVSFFISYVWALAFEYPTLNIIAIWLAKRR